MYTTKTLFSDRKNLLIVTFFMLLANTIAQGVPFLIKTLSDGVNGLELWLLLAVAAGLVLVGILRYFSDMLADTYFFRFSGRLGYRMLRDLLNAVIVSDKSIFARMNPDQLSRMATSDIETLRTRILNRYFVAVSTSIQIVTLLGFVIALDWMLGAITIAWYSCFYFFTRKKVDGIQARRADERLAYTRVLTFTKDALYGNFDIKYFSDRVPFLSRFDALNLAHIDKNVHLMVSAAFSRYFSYVGSFVSIAILLLYKAFLKPDVSTGTLLAMYMYTNSYSSIFSGILSLRSSGKDIKALIAPIDEFFETAQAKQALELTDCGPVNSIELRNISVSYDGRSIIRDCSATFERGSVYLVNGKSGAGKTSLINAMLGEIDCEGRVLYNGLDLGGISRESLHGRIGIVRQNMYLLNATVRENITMFSDAYTEEQIRHAADSSQVSELNQDIGTSEIDTVSGGERKRIALARLLLRLDKKDVVILDETFANLDMHTIRKLAAEILARALDKILIVVTHDDAVRALFCTGRTVELDLPSCDERQCARAASVPG